MNEIVLFKMIKEVSKMGIPKSEARYIVSEVVDIVGTNDIEKLNKSINYAINLTYRIGINKNLLTS